MDTHELFDAYVGHVLEHGGPPPSVHRFCKDAGLSEGEFYREFASFEALESEFWAGEVGEVVSAIRGGGEWDGFDARQKMLTFLYALVARGLERRSFLLLRFQGVNPLAHPSWMRGWWSSVKEFTKSVVDEGVESGAIADRGRVLSLYPDMLAVLTRSVLDYFARDTSKGFEKTDAFIEKSCALAFDLMQTQALDSAFDLLKFLAPGHSPPPRKAKPHPSTPAEESHE